MRIISSLHQKIGKTNYTHALITAADGEKRAEEERNRSKAEARGHEAPLGEVRLSEERLPSSQQSDWLRCPQAEEFSERVRHPEELDADLPLGWRTRIASETLGP